MRTSACIFDLDGVIVDTAKYHFLAWKKLADQIGIIFTENDNERLKGVSRMDSLEIILEIGDRKLNNKLKHDYATLKNNWYVNYISRMTPDDILPGCLEFINELKNAGILVAIGSASKNTPMILERVGIKELFNAVADGNIVSNAKPDPEVFIKAAKMVGIEPGNCVVFEDAVAGVQAALNAGMMCIGIGSSRILSEAHYVVSGLNEMNLEKLKTIEKNIRL
ncbi:MAG: beta-phosphoglucomutase [Bacteroidetes bacterium]|nr:beta-phosphoglucomutase [Bacteroidota bacterium]